MKVLYWKGDGFVLLYKRLENGKFVWPRNKDEVMKITDQQFRWLLEGLKIEQPRTIKRVIKDVLFSFILRIFCVKYGIIQTVKECFE